ncbi:hypothetical protein BC628DRAFT_1372583 [Trametes gibbosa]|nr:hypothetical protein BC628DRAFT_1372583 [Trametes gibbosa]
MPTPTSDISQLPSVPSPPLTSPSPPSLPDDPPASSRAPSHTPSPPASPPSKHTSPPSAATPSSNPSTSTTSQLSIEDQLERLTAVVQETAHLIHVCTALCEARCAEVRARAEADRKRAGDVQEQLRRMMEMTKEMVRRESERSRVSCEFNFSAAPWGRGKRSCPNADSLRVADPQKYARDLQRAAFGAGGTADSISRSSMMETGKYHTYHSLFAKVALVAELSG